MNDHEQTYIITKALPKIWLLHTT